jgi:hypothetical protein
MIMGMSLTHDHILREFAVTLAELLCCALNDKYGKDRYNYVAWGSSYGIYNIDYLIMDVNDRCICIYGRNLYDIILFNDPKIDVFAMVCRSLCNHGYESHP